MWVPCLLLCSIPLVLAQNTNNSFLTHESLYHTISFSCGVPLLLEGILLNSVYLVSLLMLILTVKARTAL